MVEIVGSLVCFFGAMILLMHLFGWLSERVGNWIFILFIPVFGVVLYFLGVVKE